MLFWILSLVFLFLCSLAVNPPRTEKTGKIPWNITDDLLSDYDKRLRPNFGDSKKPVNVFVDIVIGSIDRISEVNMDYTMTIYLRQYWKDERLTYKYDKLNVLPVDGRITDRLWLPDTYFTNDKDSYLQDITVKNRMLRIFPNGEIVYGLRLSVTASCVYNLQKFPHDVQNCSLNLESYGYNTNDTRLTWKLNNETNKCASGFETVEIPQFRVIKNSCSNTTATFSSGNYDRLFLHFLLARSVGYFVFQTYMPCVMVVCMSWVSFWINYESSPARVALGITTVLTMTTIFTSARESLPRFSYVKAIDIYLLTCFVFVFASLLEFALVNFNFWKYKHRDTKKIKKEVRTQCKENAYYDQMIAVRLADQSHDVHVQSPTLPRKEGNNVLTQRTPWSSDERKNETRFQRGFIRPFVSEVGYNNHQMSSMGVFQPVHAPQRRAVNYIQPSRHDEHVNTFSQRRGQKLVRPYELDKTPDEPFPGCNVASLRNIKFPAGERVLVIDRYARILFPIVFIIFNVIYWWYYVM